ncbi:MAG: T9SS type A sorting domain-containing protein [Lepagella sp.]
MKKVYLLMAGVMMAGIANAKTLNFIEEESGNVIPNGSTYTSSECTDLEVMKMYDPKISVLADESMTVSMTAECTTGQMIQLCLGGDCVAGVTVTKNNVQLVGGEALPTLFEYTWVDGEDLPEQVVTNLDIKETGVLGSGASSSIVVVINTNTGAVSTLKVDDAFRYANGAINYSVEKASLVELYDTTGKCVLSQEVSGNGTISTEGISTGIYMYRVGNKTGKIFVK